MIFHTHLYVNAMTPFLDDPALLAPPRTVAMPRGDGSRHDNMPVGEFYALVKERIAFRSSDL